MKLSEIKPVDYAHALTHPASGVEIGLKITLVSLDDDRMKSVKRNINDRNLAKRQRNKMLTTVDQEKGQLDLILNAAIDWEWYNGLEYTDEDQTPEFSRAKLADILTTIPWAINQLDEALGTEANFFPK